ncbi:MAG: hypothetical protein ACRCSQ_00805, partial [Bacteroidales bacterium]
WASKGWEIVDGKIVEAEDRDGVNGKEIILQKLSICRTWLAEAWNIDLDRLRDEVQKRQNDIDLDEMRKELDQYKL